jgi:hypothetical protein
MMVLVLQRREMCDCGMYFYATSHIMLVLLFCSFVIVSPRITISELQYVLTNLTLDF